MSPAGGNLQSDNRKGRDLQFHRSSCPLQVLNSVSYQHLANASVSRLAFLAHASSRINNLEAGNECCTPFEDFPENL